MSRKVTKADWEEYQKRKKEDEEKKRKQNSSSASATTKSTTKSSTKKTTVTTKNGDTYSMPFFSTAEKLKEKQKKEREHTRNIGKYATGQIDSTVAENMGINTTEINNLTNKISQKDLNVLFTPRTASTTNNQQVNTEKPLTTQRVGMGGMKYTDAPASIGTLGNMPASNNRYKFSNEKDYAEYENNVKKIADLNRKINLKNNSRGYYIKGVTDVDLEAEKEKLEKRNAELLKPYEKNIAEENTKQLDTLPLGDIAGEYTRLERGYNDEKGKNLTNGDEYKSFQNYYFWRLNQGMSEQGFQEYVDKMATDFPKLNNANEHIAKTPKINSYYAYMTPEERHYYNYLGQQESGSILQSDYDEMLLPALMTRKANETPSGNAATQVLSNLAGGVAKSVADVGTGIRSQLGIGNYWKDEAPQYGFVKDSVDTNKAGTLQQFANSTANAIGYMAPSLAGTYLTGGSILGSLPMGLATAGNTYTEAINNGVTDEQARSRGLLRGAAEIGTNKLLGGIKGLGGGKLATTLAKTGLGTKALDIASKAVSKLKNPKVRAILVNSGKVAANASSEMFEEYLQDYVIAPTIENMTGGNRQIDLWDENTPELLATAALTTFLLNAPSDVGNLAKDLRIKPQNTENVASAFDVSEKENASDIVNGENTNSLTTQNKGNLEGVENYSEETQNVLSRLTPAGAELLLTGKLSNPQIKSLAEEIKTSEIQDTKYERQKQIEHAMREIQSVKASEFNVSENNALSDNSADLNKPTQPSDLKQGWLDAHNSKYSALEQRTDDANTRFADEMRENEFYEMEIENKIEDAKYMLSDASPLSQESKNALLSGKLNDFQREKILKEMKNTKHNGIYESIVERNNEIDSILDVVNKGYLKSNVETISDTNTDNVLTTPAETKPEQTFSNTDLNANNQNNVTAPQNNIRQRPEGITDNLYDTGQFIEKSPDKVPSEKKIKKSENFVLNYLDSLGAVKKVAKAIRSNTVYQSAQAAKKGRAMAEYALTKNQTDAYGNVVGKSVAEILAPMIDTKKGNFNSDYTLFQKYLHNYNFEGRETAGKKNLADNMILSKEEMTRLEQEHPEFKQMADDVFAFIKNGQDYMVDTGIWSKEFRDELRAKYPYYLPSHRLMENADNKNNFFSSATNISNLIKTAKGSDKTILPIHEELIDYANAMYTQGVTNQFLNTLAQGFETMKADNPKRPHIYDVKPYHKGMTMPEYSMSFYKDGQQYVMEMDEYLYKGLDDLMNKAKSDPDMKTWFAKAFKAVTTDMNPVFTVLKNPPKDFKSAIRNSEHPAEYALNLTKYGGKTVSFRLHLKNDKFWQLYEARGLTENGSIELSDKTNFYSKRNKSGLRSYRYATDGINKSGYFFEQAFRFIEFKATLDAEGLTQKIENGEKLNAADLEIVNRAAYNASKVTADFGTAGIKIRELNKTTPYLNAQIQGNIQHYRNFADAKINASNPKQAAASLIYRTIMYGGAAAATLAIAMMREDNEEYQKLSDYEKSKYDYLFWNDKPIIKFAKDEYQQLLFDFSDIVISLKEGASAKEIVGQTIMFMANFVPIPLTSNLAFPLVRVGIGGEKSGVTWNGQQIEGKSISEKPIEERYTEDTSELAKMLSSFLLSEIGLSPVEIDDLFNSYLGGYWDMGLPFLQSKTWTSEEPGKELASAFIEPFAKQLVPQNKLSRSGIAGEFYNTKEMYAHNANSDNATALDEYMNSFVKRNDDEISALTKSYKNIEGNEATSFLIQGDKKNKMLNLKEQKETLMSDVINNAPKYKEAAEKVLAKYPDFDYANATEKEKNYIQMQIDKEFGGSEYAIQNLNKETYEKAQENHDAHDLSYDDIYAYLLEKQTLPEDISNEDEIEHMEKWLLNTKDVSSKDAKNALGTAYVNKTTVLTDTYDYDFTDKNSMDISKMTNTDEAKYYKTKQVFGDVVTPETYNYYKEAYDSGETKEEKMAALRAAGLNESSAKAFYGIQSGQKAYKTGVTGTETRLRKEMNFHSSVAEDIVREYEKVYNSDPKKERELQINFVRNIVKQLNPEYISYFGGENGTINAMLDILDDM